MFVQWVLLTLMIITAMSADRAWNLRFKFSAYLAASFFVVNALLFAAVTILGQSAVDYIVQYPAWNMKM